MNRWAARHADVLVGDLQPGETLLAAARVALHRSRFGRSSTLPVPGRVVVVGLTDRRVLIWSTSAWLGRPHRLVTAIAVDQVASLVTLRSLGGTRLHLLLTTGETLVLDSTWGGSVRDVSRAFAAYRPTR